MFRLGNFKSVQSIMIIVNISKFAMQEMEGNILDFILHL